MNRTGSGNPALSEKVFRRYAVAADSEVMTVGGTVNKTFLLFLLLLASAAYVWNRFVTLGTGTGLMYVGFIGGFILAMITAFKVQWSPYTAPVYAVFEGLALGGLSAFVEAMYPGIVMKAVALTFGVFFMMLFLYRSGIIKPTQRFTMGVVAATGGIALVYFVSWIASMFGAQVGFLYGNSNFSIGLSLFIVVIAALNLVLDFAFIDQASAQGAPKFMEWYAAFGLMVTLVWLYIEILRLLSKLASRE